MGRYPEEAIDASAALVAAFLKLLLAKHGETTENCKLSRLVGDAKPLLTARFEAIGLSSSDSQQFVQGSRLWSTASPGYATMSRQPTQTSRRKSPLKRPQH